MSVNLPEPLVSAIIPTRNRPGTVLRAVRSALDQTLRECEVIVVIDGKDEATSRVLESLADPRLRVVGLEDSQGCAAARNVGTSLARSSWVAFLDDDDYWLPGKLEIQLQTARQCNCRSPIVAVRIIARSEKGDYHWPRRVPAADENLSEYLFCRRSPFGGEGLVLPSAIMVPKELVTSVPFTPGLVFHNDYDWLLRACRFGGARVVFVPTEEPLVVWHIEENRPRLSNDTDWHYALSWIHDKRDLVTPRAYASFVLTEAVMRAAAGRHWGAFALLLKDAYTHGKPSFNDVISYLGVWLVPRPSARSIALLADRLHHRRMKTHGLVKAAAHDANK
jgi:glycosyltransferase involved in cell wall biosynthesis